MKSIRTNFVAFLVAAIFTMACVCPVSAQETEVSLISDVQTNSVTILGKLCDSAGVNYIVNIDEFSEDDVVFSEGNPPMDSRLFTTYQNGTIGSDAEHGHGEVIYYDPERFEPGRYNMYINYEGAAPQKLVFTIYDPAVAEAHVILLSTADRATFETALSSDGVLTDLGIYSGDIAASGAAAFGHAFDVRPEGGYDLHNIIESVNQIQADIYDGDALYYLKNSGVASVPASKTRLLGSAYTEYYPSLTATEKTALDTLLKSADYTSEPLAAVFEDMVITAKIKACDNKTDMMSTVLAFKGKLGISTGSGSFYAGIDTLNQPLVFDRMVNERAGFAKMADIAASYAEHAEDVYKNPPGSGDDGDGGGGGGGFGGGGGAGGGTQTSSGNLLNPGGAGIFNDIAGHFAKNDIIKLANLGIINGFADGSYRPYENVTRGQYAKLICTAFGFTGGYAQFADVPFDQWYAPYVNALAAQGIITGYDGYFYPEDNIKREDAALIINRVARIQAINAVNGAAISFADEASISPYAKEAVSELSRLGIMNGDGVSFHPLNLITRGEAAAVISRLYDMYAAKGV